MCDTRGILYAVGLLYVARDVQTFPGPKLGAMWTTVEDDKASTTEYIASVVIWTTHLRCFLQKGSLLISDFQGPYHPLKGVVLKRKVLFITRCRPPRWPLVHYDNISA